jgi:hypothetical protein
MRLLTKGRNMDRTAADTVTKAFLAQIYRKLQEATSIAKAAEVCAESGSIETALKMIMDVENPTHQVDRMLSAALLIRGELMDGPD